MAPPSSASGGSGSARSSAAGGGSRSSRAKPGILTVSGGRRELKGYTVTGDELLALGAVQGMTALAFALAGSFFGFWLSTKQAIELAGRDTSIASKAQWLAYGDVGFWGGITLAALGVGLFGYSGWRAFKIMRDTIHD